MNTNRALSYSARKSSEQHVSEGVFLREERTSRTIRERFVNADAGLEPPLLRRFGPAFPEIAQPRCDDHENSVARSVVRVTR